MPAIRVKENEPFEVAMRRFKRAVEKTGLLTELRAREAYEKPTTERKRKKAAANNCLLKCTKHQLQVCPVMPKHTARLDLRCVLFFRRPVRQKVV